ncbi:MAG: EamA family transporter [bacterium]
MTATTASSNVAAIPLILTSVLLGAVGQLTMKNGFNLLKTRSDWGDFTFVQKLPQIFLQPYVILGLSLYVIATFVWFAVLDKADLSFAYPFIALAYVVTAIGSYLLFGEQINNWKIAAITLIMLGVLCLARGAQLAQASASTPKSPTTTS